MLVDKVCIDQGLKKKIKIDTKTRTKDNMKYKS